MSRAAWCTDIHLNFLDDGQRQAFIRDVQAANPDVLLISGDIGEAPSVAGYLEELHAALNCRICFVLGNHDFYKGSIAGVRGRIAALAERHPRLQYLTAEGVVPLSPGTCVVGHDGWADARLGDFANSGIMLNDYLLISELSCLGKSELARTLNALGDEAAAHLRESLEDALAAYPSVMVITHVPPFAESCHFRQRPSDPQWLPHFSCAAVGEVLLQAMQRHPERRMTVLCGHTHCHVEAQILSNLRVITGGAEYGRPVVQQAFELDPH